MSTLLLTLVLAAAPANCQAHLTARYTAIAAEAYRLTLTPAPTFSIGEAEPRSEAAFYRHKYSIVASPVLCTLPLDIQDYILAHELGHAVTWKFYPQLPSGPVHEQQADFQAAHILGPVVSRTTAETLQGFCADGYRNTCQTRLNLLYASTH